jgi:hypothetical protein
MDMTDPRVEEAYGLLHQAGGPSAEALRRARELIRAWLQEADLAADAAALDEDEAPESWQDVPAPEVLAVKARIAHRPR